MAISCTSRVLSSICRDGELWVWICGRYGCWTAGHCALHQHTAEGGRERGCYGRLSGVDCLRKKCCRAEVTTEECAARMQSYHSFLHNSLVMSYALCICLVYTIQYCECATGEPFAWKRFLQWCHLCPKSISHISDHLSMLKFLWMCNYCPIYIFIATCEDGSKEFSVPLLHNCAMLNNFHIKWAL